MKTKLYTISLVLMFLCFFSTKAQYDILWVGDETNTVDSALIDFLDLPGV